MKRICRAILASLIALFILTAFTVPSASACGVQDVDLRVRILRAYADDLDGDDLYDTAVTTLVLCRPKTYFQICFVIITPDGNTLTVIYEVYSKHQASINRFVLCDTISVEGWYTITAYVTCPYGTAVSQAYSYDPGGGTPGPL